jgi:feruloyl-CoA synthase
MTGREAAGMSVTQPPFRATYFPSSQMRVERRPDGSLIVEPATPLDPFVPSLPAQLADWAARDPGRPCIAQRDGKGGPWLQRSFGEFKSAADAVTQWLLDRNVPPGRSVLILSGNSIAHAVVKFGGMASGIPICPVSANYSLMAGDFGRLRHVVKLVRPAVVFAEQTAAFKRALETVDFGDAVVITADPAAVARPTVGFAEVLGTTVTPAVQQAIATLDPDAHSLYMLTSGSTSMPKAVVQTQRMVCANIAQARQVLAQTAGWTENMLDWLPWSHVSGACNQFATLCSGGSFYIDDGRPLPGLFDESLRNIKEIPPSFHINVPFGYAMLADALEGDAELRERFFRNLRLALYGGAGLPQALYDRIQKLAVDTIGERIFFTTGYGATETTSGCMSIYFPTETVGIGLPMPGMTLKLVPNGPRYEVRVRGQIVTPGYLANEDANRGIFDEEGFYRTGDTAQMHDPGDIQKGLRFAGRLAEDFKLGTGSWVAAGKLRAEFLEAFSPLIADVVVCGENLSYIALLAWPKVPRTAELEAELRARLQRFNAGRGLSERVERLALLTEPPSADQHEVSDKGTINQRVALARRAVDVARLYEATPAPGTLLPEPGTSTPSINSSTAER